jgi:hypothetical protein
LEDSEKRLSTEDEKKVRERHVEVSTREVDTAAELLSGGDFVALDPAEANRVRYVLSSLFLWLQRLYGILRIDERLTGISFRSCAVSIHFLFITVAHSCLFYLSPVLVRLTSFGHLTVHKRYV